MSRATPKMRVFAERLIASETREVEPGMAARSGSLLVGEALAPHLAMQMGGIGARALLARAVLLARADLPWLNGMTVRPDGSLEGFDAVSTTMGPEIILECRIVVLAQLLGLLVAFIGENLTLQLAHDAWPKLPSKQLNFD